MRLKTIITFTITANIDEKAYPIRCKTNEERLESEMVLADQLGHLDYLIGCYEAFEEEEIESTITMEVL
jgi:hypothetical protein